MLQKSYAGIVTAALIIEVIDEGPFFAVVEEYPDHAEAARKGGVLFFDYLSLSPKVIPEMFHRISYSEIQSRSHVFMIHFSVGRNPFDQEEARAGRINGPFCYI